jgi:hypothetical protein
MFDKVPPAIYNAFANTTDSFGGYDLLGRFLYARLTQSF